MSSDSALEGGFVAAARQLHAPGPDEQLLAREAGLVRRYREPHRRYHDVNHLIEVIDHTRRFAAPAIAPPVTVLAAWYHDAVYEPSAAGAANEEASARLAEAELHDLAVDAQAVAEVGRLVRLTAAHDVSRDDAAAALLIDADLAILGAPRKRYQRYVDGIRAEYHAVDDERWAVGRSAVLSGLLGRARIYATTTAHTTLDAAARANMTWELATLSRAQP